MKKSDHLKQKFEAQLQQLYADYCEHMKAYGIEPDSYKAFEAVVMQRITQKVILDKQKNIPKEDYRYTTYITQRVRDVPNPAVTSYMLQCDNCSEDVWVDASNIDMAQQCKAIYCSVCVSEMTGKSQAEILRENLK